MGIFRKHDELFEIMSRRPVGSRNPSITGPNRTPITQPPQPTPTTSTTSSISRRLTSSFGPRRAVLDNQPDLLEVGGDALIVVEDGWTLSDTSDGFADEEGKTFAIRGDTVAVGACLLGALVIAAFLFGRSSSEAATSMQVKVEGEPIATQVATAEPAPVAPQPTPTLSTSSVTPSAPQAASFKPDQTTSAQPASAPSVKTTVAAAAPKAQVRLTKPGKWTLLVCTTTPTNARKLAKWLNESGLSPIFGRKGLEAEASRRGVVKIRGFQERESDVEAQVKATHDPLGNGGTFHSAYFVKRP